MTVSTFRSLSLLFLLLCALVNPCMSQSLDWHDFKASLGPNLDANSEKISQYIESDKTSDPDKVKALVFMSSQACQFGLLDEAEGFIQQARGLLDEKDSIIKRSLLLRESVVAAMKHEYERCIRVATECIELSKKIDPDDPYVVSAYNERGIAYQYTGQYRKAIKDYKHALDISKELKNERYSLKMLVNLGATYNELKAFDKADEKYKEALSTVEKFKDLHSKVPLLVNLGNNSLDWAKSDVAEKYYNEAREIYESENKIYPNGSLYIGLGDIAWGKKDFLKAQEYFQSAKNEYTKAQDKVGIRRSESRMARIAKFIVNAGEPSKNAQQENDDEIAKLKKIIDESLLTDKSRDRGQLLGDLAGLYEQQQKWREAATTFKESLHASRDDWDEISKLSVETLEEKDLAISRLNRSNRFLWILLFCLAIVSTGLFVFWRSKLNANRRLALANATTQQEKQKNSILLQQLAEKQKESGLATMSAGVLHDFNNYLAAIVTSAESGLSAEPSKKDFFLNNVVKSGMSASQLTQNIYEFVGKGLPNDAGSCSLVQLFKKNQTTWSNLTDENVTLSVDVENNHELLLPISEAELDRIIINLIKNSNEAVNNRGKILLQATNTADKDFCRITVIDDGPGMSEDVLSCALDPYFSTKGIGRGLGLATVKGIVERCGGMIRVKRAKDHGTEICIELPTITAKQHKTIQDTLMNRVSRSSFKIPPGARLLLVEDDPVVLQGLVPMIESLGIVVEKFSDFRSAQNYIQNSKNHVDALVTDFALGGGANGRDLAYAAKKIDPRCRVLLISGYAEQEVFENDSFDGFLAKPFTRHELSAALLELLGTSEVGTISEVA